MLKLAEISFLILILAYHLNVLLRHPPPPQAPHGLSRGVYGVKNTNFQCRVFYDFVFIRQACHGFTYSFIDWSLRYLVQARPMPYWPKRTTQHAKKVDFRPVRPTSSHRRLGRTYKHDNGKNPYSAYEIANITAAPRLDDESFGPETGQSDCGMRVAIQGDRHNQLPLCQLPTGPFG